MIIFQNDKLTLNDNLFFVYDLRRLINERNKIDNTSIINSITELAKLGQIESIEYYYNTLPANKQENIAIFAKIQNIIEKPKQKTPREYMAIAEYYNWHAKKNQYTKTNFDQYLRLYEQNKNKSINLLEQKKLDLNAQEYLFEHKAKENKEFNNSFKIFNFRNSLYSKIHDKTYISPEAKTRFLYAYSKNLIMFATDQEYSIKIGEVEDFIHTLHSKVNTSEQRF